MLIISNEQFLAELKSSESESIKRSKNGGNPVIPTEIELSSNTYDNFRKPEGPNIPEEVKSIVGALSSIDGQKEVAETFGISKDTVGNLANDNHKNSQVSEKRVAIIERIKENTSKKIEQCVEFLEVVKGTNNKELLYTAESLSRIHRNISPASAPNEGSGVQFIFYAPERQNKVEDYDIIDAN